MEGIKAGASGGEQGKQRVMVAIDESECSYYALEWTLQNLRACLAAPLLVFTAQPVTNLSYIPAATYGSVPPELIQSLQENQKKITQALLGQAKEICAKYGVNAEIMTEIGEPKESICEAVEKHHVDLLILGSHGRGAIQRAFLGSVSSYCVHQAKCAVLVVKK